MQRAKNLYTFPVYCFLLTGLVSCGSLPYSLNSINLSLGTNVSNIAALKPATDNEDTVYLRGQVTQQVPLVDWRIYQLQDTTGKIWVVTNKTDLQLGDTVLIEGKVRYQSIPIAGQEYGEVYIEEQRQLERTPTLVGDSRW